MTVHDFREIIQHQAFPELVKHGEDSHGGVKYDSSNGQNVSSEEYTLVVNLLDALMKNKNVTKHTLSCCLFFQWTQIQCIRRSQYHQPGHWCCHSWRCLSENREGVKWNLFLFYHCSVKATNQKSNYASHIILKLNAITNLDKIVLTLSTSSDSSKSVTSLADTRMLSASPEQRYLKHHSCMKLGQGPPCARLAAMTSPALLIKTKQHINCLNVFTIILDRVK